MKYRVKITKQPRYQTGGSRTLGDFSNMTEDQLENGPVYGFRSEPEIPQNISVNTMGPINMEPVNNSMEELKIANIPSEPVKIVGTPVSLSDLRKRPEYKGVSVVDFLNQLGLPTSKQFRTKLAKEYGINNYTGTAIQNKQLISILSNIKDNLINLESDNYNIPNNNIKTVPYKNILVNNDAEMAKIADERINQYKLNQIFYPFGNNQKRQVLPNIYKYIKQTGGEQDQQQQIIQVVQAYAQQSGVDPKAILLQLQKMQPEQQQQAIQQMYAAVSSQDAGGEDTSEEMMQSNDGTGYAAYGGQMGYGLDLGARRLWMNQDSDESSQVNDSIEEVPRDEANIEAEGGETALIPNEGDQGYTHKKIKGNRHTEGGVPLNVPEGTFIYSDTKKMKLGGPVLKMFGKSEKSTKKFTPATLAKQYNLDKYRAILEDPKSDPIAKRTAELMIQNYEKKLAQLALVQESKKGFPQGIPQVAQNYYNQMLAASGKQGEDIEGTQEDKQELQEETQPQAMYGMGFRYGGGLDKYQGDEYGSEYNRYGNKYRMNGSSIPSFDSAIAGSPTKNGNISFDNSTTPIYEPNPDIDGLERPSEQVKNIIPYNFTKYNFTPNEVFYGGYNSKLPGSKYSLDPQTAEPLTGMENAVENPSTKIKPESKFNTYDGGIKYGWSTPDKLNLLNSMINLASVRRSTPFEPAVQLQRAQTYYTDPSRALAANAEQMNAARQSAGMFAGPQSRYSFNAGQFGKNAADIIGQYAMQNVGLGNQAAQQNAAINNQQIQYDAQRAKRLYDAGVIGEQQYQNAMRQARAAVLQSYTQGSENAANLYNLSSTQSPYFAYDPSKRTIYFRSEQARKDFFDPNKQNKNDDYFAMMDRLMNDYSMSADKAAERASQRFGKQPMSKE